MRIWLNRIAQRPQPPANGRGSERGSALLAVLGTIVALTAIGFAMATSVRTEIDRASLSVDSTKAYFLAHGGIEAAMQRIVMPANPANEEEGFSVGQRFLRFDFPTGAVDIEIIGEAGKLDVNQASPEALDRLLRFSGVEPGRAVALSLAIVDFRTRLREGRVRRYSPADASTANLGPESTFEGQPASIQEVEELLAIPGMTPDVLYGTFRRVESTRRRVGSKTFVEGPRLQRFGGLMGNLTTQGGTSVDVNYASVEMLRAAGLPDALIASIVEIRRIRPLTASDSGMQDLASQRGEIPVGLGGRSKRYTVVATARLNESNSGRTRAVRSVAAVVELGTSEGPDPIRIVRWYDQPF